MADKNNMTKYFRKLVLNSLRGENIKGFETVYIALFTTDTGADGSGVEVTGGGYQRMPIKLSEPYDGADFTEVSNMNEIDFGIATADWGLIVNAGIFDSKTGGNMLYHGKLHSTQNIETGDSIRFAENQLIIGEN